MRDCTSLISSSVAQYVAKGGKSCVTLKFTCAEFANNECLNRLVEVLKNELESTASLFDTLTSEDLGPNFDIFEITLMKEICQLNEMFLKADPKLQYCPSLLISDPEARYFSYFLASNLV